MKWINILLLMLFLLSCENTRIEQMSFTKDDIEIRYIGKPNILKYTISSGDIILFTNNLDVINGGVYSLPLLTKEDIEKKADSLAYILTQKGFFDINYNIKLGSTILADSVTSYTYNHFEDTTNLVYAELLTDKYGTIQKNDYSQYNKRAKTFLVENNLRTNKSFVERMAYNIYILLNYGQENRYKLSNVKIFGVFPKTPVIVRTNMSAKYFYLVAVENEDKIKEFARNEIVDDYKQGNINTIDGDKQIQLNLTKLDDSNDLLYIFLLGINDNWNYDYQFVGGMILDNMAPFISWKGQLIDGLYSPGKTPTYGEIKFKDFYIEYNEYYCINSTIYEVNWGNFAGNDYSGYPITLSVKFYNLGDFDHLILQGKKYDNKYNDVNHERFVFEHRFPQLNTGNNYISIKFVDQVGNSSSGKINIRTERNRDNDIEINNIIYNDIEINNSIYNDIE